MISIIIIEDDPISSDLLVSMLQEIQEDIYIKKILRSIKEAVAYFDANLEIDLILSDIQLSDGLSFSIFEQVETKCPVIFTSAYDKYLVNAFDYSGIDYLIKPFTIEGLQQSIQKYQQLQNHFTRNNGAINTFIDTYVSNRKTRIIVKKGAASISLLFSDIVFFYTEHLVVYVYDNKGNKYLIDKSLNALEFELDKRMFYRVNRQYILNVNYVQGYKIYERVKLLVSLNFKQFDKLILVGQEKSRSFKQWLAES